MSSSIVLNSNLLKSTGLLYVLSVILFTNNALCSKRRIEVNPSLNHGEPLEKTAKSINEEELSPLEVKQIIQPIYTNKDFITFKILIGEAFTDSYQVYKDLQRYESFHVELLDDLYTLILNYSPESSDFNNSENFYFEINNLLNDFDNLLNQKKSFENVSGDYIKAILDLFPCFEKISEQLPEMKRLFGIQNEDLFYGLYDDLRSLEFTTKNMKKIYDLYVHWMIVNMIIYSYCNEILEDFKKKNEFLKNETTLANLGDEVSNHRKNLKENISKFFINYYNCAKDFSKCLHKFVSSMETFTIYCEGCDSEHNDMKEIFEKY